MDPTSRFKLAAADCKDIGRLAQIHVIACLPDNAFKLYFKTPAEFEQRITAMLEGQIGNPTWQHIKAVDKESGVIAAWASWNTPTDAQIGERDQKAAKNVMNSNRSLKKGEFDFPPGLPTYVQADTDKWLER